MSEMTNPGNERDRADQDADAGQSDRAIPRPIVKKMRWPFPIIWIVPVAAAALAGYYVLQHHKEHGTELTIEFADGDGLKKDQTEVRLHGITIGRVSSVELSDDHQRARVHVRIAESASFIARQQTIFWIVRPEFSVSSVSGLNTILSGPVIQVRPGGGAPTDEFSGMSEEPIINGPGIKIVLHADALGSITLDRPGHLPRRAGWRRSGHPPERRFRRGQYYNLCMGAIRDSRPRQFGVLVREGRRH